MIAPASDGNMRPVPGALLTAVVSFAPIPAVILLGVALFALHRRKLRGAAAAWGGRTPMPDAEFLRLCEVPDEPFAARAALAARRAIASLATVPPETILPDDSFYHDLRHLPFWDSLDWLGFVFEVEKQANHELRVMGAVAEGAVRAAGDFKRLRVRHIVRSVMTAAISR